MNYARAQFLIITHLFRFFHQKWKNIPIRRFNEAKLFMTRYNAFVQKNPYPMDFSPNQRFPKY